MSNQARCCAIELSQWYGDKGSLNEWALNRQLHQITRKWVGWTMNICKRNPFDTNYDAEVRTSSQSPLNNGLKNWESRDGSIQHCSDFLRLVAHLR